MALTSVVQMSDVPEKPSAADAPHELERAAREPGPSSLRELKFPTGSPWSDSERKIAVTVEQRIMQVIRREVRDPYAGLPADDVLERLDKQHPDVKFPERMMRRLEVEQANRAELESKRVANEAYELESARLARESSDELVKGAGRRAFGVLIVLLVAGVGLVLAGHEAAGSVVLGTSLVGVVGAFITQQVRRRKD